MSDDVSLIRNPRSVVFTPDDLVFVPDPVAAAYLIDRCDPSLVTRAWLCPMTVRALGVLLGRGVDFGRILLAFPDFERSRVAYSEALGQARRWLKELGLEVAVEGIDLATFDASCQHGFFVHARCMAEVACRAFNGRPQSGRVFVPTRPRWLTQDFYFDSDVAAAMVLYAGALVGRSVGRIAIDVPLFNFPSHATRPMLESVSNWDIPDSPAPRTRTGPRIGFAPATVRNREEIFNALAALDAETTVFPSTWEGLDSAFMKACVCPVPLHSNDASAELSRTLEALHAHFLERRHASTLPPCLVQNRFLDFQHDYVIKRRWHAYGKLIAGAATVVRERPLDLFIMSDVWTAESCALATFYRRAGTPILIAPHSGWPVSVPWGSWAPRDTAMVWSRSAKDRLCQYSGMTAISVTGSPRSETYRNLTYDPVGDQIAKLAQDGRKLVVLVANALELQGVPLVDLSAHFDALRILAKVPDHLRDRVCLAVKLKPGPLGDPAAVYKHLGFSIQSLRVLEGLHFSEAIANADCAIGVNIPTTAYFEVMERGVPLLHVQNVEPLEPEPDLSPDQLGRIDSVDRIWPEIEAALFDPEVRAGIIGRQKRFLELDRAIEPWMGGEAVRAVIELRAQYGWRRFFNRIRRAFHNHRGSVGLHRPVNVSARADGCTGWIDCVLLGSKGTYVLEGWAADIKGGIPARRVHVLVGSRWDSEADVRRSRPDLLDAYPGLISSRCGFSVPFRLRRFETLREVRLLAETLDCRFFEMPLPQETLTGVSANGTKSA